MTIACSKLLKNNLLITLISCMFQFGFSQSEKLIHGKALNEKFSVEGVSIVNLFNNTITKTALDGGFSIMAKTGDTLVFVSTNYYRKIALKQQDFDNPNFTVQLVQKTIELDEVEVKKKADFNSQAIVDRQFTADQNTSVKNPLVYDAMIPNGMNLTRIGKMIGKLFKGKEKPAPQKIQFGTYVNSHIDNNFYLKTLKLKPEEITLFLEFCKTDPNSDNIVQTNNILSVMDFLIAKNTQFRK